MKSLPNLLSCLGCLAFTPILQAAAADGPAAADRKIPVIVLQGEVTIDGQQRPDLGRSFSDTLTGGFLKAKSYSVIDHLSNQPIAQAVENSTQLAPELSSVSVGEATGASWIYVPRMVVEGDFHKLTLKKIRVSDGQVVDVFETHADGDRTTMFRLVGDALKDIYANAASDAAQQRKMAASTQLDHLDADELDPTPTLPAGSYTPAPDSAPDSVPDPVLDDPLAEPIATAAEESSPITDPVTPEDEEPVAEIIATPEKSVPAGLKLVNGTHVRDDASLSAKRPAAAAAKLAQSAEIKDPATETEEKVARYVGTVASINSEWRFCVLKMRGSESLRKGDQLSVKTGAIVPNQITLKVTKTEGRQTVADLLSSADLSSLKAGQKVYKWTLK
ncbi:MAG: hypothetical protein ACR2RV_00350 [Verrucomicrobiales bacterium]